MKKVFEQIRQSYVVEFHFIKFAELQPQLFSVTITVKLYIIYHGKQTLEVTFSRRIFQPLPKETAKYHFFCFISQYSTCTLHFIVGRLSGGWQYSHANKSNTVTAKEDVRQKVFLLQCNVNTDLLVFIKLKFLRILNFSQSFQEQLMTCSSCNYTI